MCVYIYTLCISVYCIHVEMKVFVDRDVGGGGAVVSSLGAVFEAANS